MSHLLSQREGFLFAYDVTYTCVNHIPPHSYVPLPGVTSKVNWNAGVHTRCQVLCGAPHSADEFIEAIRLFLGAVTHSG